MTFRHPGPAIAPVVEHRTVRRPLRGPFTGGVIPSPPVPDKGVRAVVQQLRPKADPVVRVPVGLYTDLPSAYPRWVRLNGDDRRPIGRRLPGLRDSTIELVVWGRPPVTRRGCPSDPDEVQRGLLGSTRIAQHAETRQVLHPLHERFEPPSHSRRHLSIRGPGGRPIARY